MVVGGAVVVEDVSVVVGAVVVEWVVVVVDVAGGVVMIGRVA